MITDPWDCEDCELYCVTLIPVVSLCRKQF